MNCRRCFRPDIPGRLMRTLLVVMALARAATTPGLAAQTSTATRSAAVSPAPAVAAAVAFQGVTVIDVTNGQLRRNQTVLIVGNHIQAVGRAGKVRLPAGVRVLDTRGQYLIPGLWDMHVHVDTHARE